MSTTVKNKNKMTIQYQIGFFLQPIIVEHFIEETPIIKKKTSSFKREIVSKRNKQLINRKMLDK